MTVHSRLVVRVAIFLLISAVSLPAAHAEEKLQTLSDLPQDALVVLSTRMDNLATPYDSLLAMLRDLVPADQLEAGLEGLRAWEEEVGLSLRDDLLALLGQEFTFALSLDDIDHLVGQAGSMFASGPPQSLEPILGGFLFILGVEDADHLDASLSKLVASVDGTLEMGDDGHRTIRFTLGDDPMDVLHYRHHGGFALFGFGEKPLSDAIERSESGENLLTSPEFIEVFSHLDAGPDMIGYVNLARAQELVRGSVMLNQVLTQEEALDTLYTRFVQEMDWGSGMGWASYSIPEGTVWQGFAPFDMATFMKLYLRTIGAVAVPNLLTAVDRGKQKRTSADIRTIGTAIEAYAVDNGRYPAGILEPTPVGEGSLGEMLSPIYIHVIPASDAWGNPILYVSDEEGASYRLSSPGKDGVFTPGAQGPTAGFDADIIFKNGNFIAWPEEEAQP